MNLVIPHDLNYWFLVLVAVVLGLLHWKVFSRFRHRPLLLGLIYGWIIFQGVLGYSGFLSSKLGSYPPRIMMIVLPNFIFFFYIAFSERVRKHLPRLRLQDLIWIQTFRFPLEIFLYELAYHQLLPREMTFEGRNFDILIGLSAPVVAWLTAKRKISRTLLLAWNWIGIALVTNVAFTGILSFAGIEIIKTEIPNYIISYFPFMWLPGVLVAAAYILHILAIRKLRLIATQSKT